MGLMWALISSWIWTWFELSSSCYGPDVSSPSPCYVPQICFHLLLDMGLMWVHFLIGYGPDVSLLILTIWAWCELSLPPGYGPVVSSHPSWLWTWYELSSPPGYGPDVSSHPLLAMDLMWALTPCRLCVWYKLSLLQVMGLMWALTPPGYVAYVSSHPSWLWAWCLLSIIKAKCMKGHLMKSFYCRFWHHIIAFTLLSYNIKFVRLVCVWM